MKNSLRYGMLAVWIGFGAGCVSPPGGGREESTGEAEQALSNPDYMLALPLVMDVRANPSVLPGSTGWHTTAVIQNTADAAAWIQLKAKAMNGIAYDSNWYFLGPRESVVFRPDNPGYAGTIGIPAIAAITAGGGSFKGSMLVESDRPVAAVVKLADVPVGSMGRAGGTASAFYNGLSMKSSGYDTGADLVYSTMKNRFNGSSTTLFVQNTGPTGGNAVLEVKTNDNQTYQLPFSLGPYQSMSVRGSDFTLVGTMAPWLPASCTGSANGSGGPCFGSVSLKNNPANIRFGAIAVEHPADASIPASAVIASHFHKNGPFSEAHQHGYCPLFKNQYPASLPATSGTAIMNVSSAYANITVKLRGTTSPWNAASGKEYVHTFLNVPPGRSVVVSPWAGTVGGFPPNGLGSMIIDSTHAIVAQTNESSSVTQSGYLCPSITDDNIFAPGVKRQFPDASGSSSEVRIQNVGSQPTVVTGTFTCRSGSGVFTTYMLPSKTVPAMESVDFSPVAPIPSGSLCAARFTAGNATIAGVVTEVPASGDTSVHETIRFD